jgi:peptidoglycan-N-acetylglucosamine deacetylase
MRVGVKRQAMAAVVGAAAVTILAGGGAAWAAQGCAPGAGLPVSRIVQIDATSGPLYGDITKFRRQDDILKPKEVVLTFDDGPMPWITKSILDTLDRFCTKATFFSVGRMAMAYPETLREVMGRGHTLGTHTWSHPMHMRRMSIGESVAEIEKGFAAVATAAGQPIAPFFRFPGLSDNGPMLSHLQKRGIATFTVDVVSNDSYIPSVERLTKETLAKAEARNGGIMLFHDIKAVTAKALPGILSELQRRGFRVVHLVSKHTHQPDQKYAGEFAAQLAKSSAQSRKTLPFYGAIPPDKLARETGASVVALAPPAADYMSAQQTPAKPRMTRDTQGRPMVTAGSEASSWNTTVKRSQRIRTQSITPQD